MTRDLLLVVHIAGVAAWLGANFVQLALTPWFARRSSDTTIAWVEATRWLGQRYYNVAGATIGVTGVLLVLETDFDFSAGFVAVGIATIIIGGVLGVTVFDRLARAQLDGLKGGELTVVSRARRTTLIMAVVDTSLVVITILAMVKRWHA